MHAFALNWNCIFIMAWKKKNRCYNFVIDSVPMLGKFPVFFPVFIMPMKFCRWLFAVSVNTEKTKLRKNMKESVVLSILSAVETDQSMK